MSAAVGAARKKRNPDGEAVRVIRHWPEGGIVLVVRVRRRAIRSLAGVDYTCMPNLMQYMR